MVFVVSRRVQVIAGSYFVNLPKLWANNNNLRAHDELEITLQDNLTLQIEKKPDGEGANG